ncbi:MAG: glycosyltransferase family 2 protein [Cytophaga sp.]|nr:glycosyltransferase family 2 protein [Undibacterium sp.]
MIQSKFAIIYTVKNESRLLPHAIKYHLAAGCSQIYVYLDGTTDNTVELIKDLDRVEVIASTKPCVEDNLPKWIADILPFWESDMDVRKRINTYFACNKALNQGVDWITCIDPDELLFMGFSDHVNANLIPNFLQQLPSKVDQVLMRNLEVIPTCAESDNPFLTCTIFLNRFPKTEFVFRYASAFLRRVLKNSRRLAWFDYWFYRLRFLNSLPRLMVNPINGESIPASYYLGYWNHKAFIRTKNHQEFNFVIHKWIKYKRNPQNIYRGHVLHYDLFDYKYMALKFKQRTMAPHMLNHFYCREMFSAIARTIGDVELKKFFEEYIAITDVNKIAELEEKKIATRINIASNFFSAK